MQEIKVSTPQDSQLNVFLPGAETRPMPVTLSVSYVKALSGFSHPIENTPSDYQTRHQNGS